MTNHDVVTNGDKREASPVPIEQSPALQVHLAEYAALTTRCTYWITLEAAVWPLAFLSVGFIAQMWDRDKGNHAGLLLWLAVFGVLVITWVWSQMLYEQLLATSYIELVLRPRIEGLLHDGEPFWGYESFLRKKRLESTATFAKLMTIIIMLIVPGIGLVRYVRYTFGWSDGLGLSINVAIAGLILWNVFGAMNVWHGYTHRE